ncbi:MAG: DNA repair protein RecO [Candidatus Omnitrophota bacterium]
MIQKDLGFVLRRYDFRTSSIIATVYTERFGKISVILKGFYGKKREFSSPLELCSLNEFVFYPKKSPIWLVSFVDLIHMHGYLRENFLKAQVAGIFINLIENVMQPWDVHPEIFDLLKNSLSKLENEDERKLLCIFLIKFLTLSGFKPEFTKCLVCSKYLSEDTLFSVSRGGLLCRGCSKKSDDITSVSKEAYSSLLYMQKSNLQMALRISLTKNCRHEVFYLLRRFLAYHLENDILSKFIM